MRAVAVNCYNRHRGKVNDLLTMVLVWGGCKSLIPKKNFVIQHPLKGPTLDDLEFL